VWTGLSLVLADAPGELTVQSGIRTGQGGRPRMSLLAVWSRELAREGHRGAAATRHAFTLPGGYPDLLGPDDHGQIAHAYGPNDARLRVAKARNDRDGILRRHPRRPLAGSGMITGCSSTQVIPWRARATP
jgi:hypothetical protein